MSFVKSIFNFLRFNKKNWKAVVLCILAATVFWFFNALNKSYTTNISFPITFDYDEEHYIPVKTLPSSVRMNVNGSGWDLFRRSMGFKVAPLVISLEKPAEVRKIVGATLPGVFAGQLEKLKINFVITDTVRLAFSEKVKKKFNVQIDSASQYVHPDFGLAETPRITPDTVWLEGPKEIINALPEILPITLKEKNLRRDFKDDVELGLNNAVSSNPQKFKVELNVVGFTELNKRVKLDFLNIPLRLKQGSVPHEVSCTFRLPADAAKAFSGDSLAAVIDLKNLPKGNHKLVPEIKGLPATATLVKADTVFVNF